MNEVTMSLSDAGSVGGCRIPFRGRLFVYLAVWFLAAVSIQIFLRPEGGTVTDLTEIQQRVRWPFYTPVMAIVGLAQSATWPAFPNASAGLLAGACLVVSTIATLVCARRGLFIVLTSVQALLLTIGVVYFIRMSRLPCGG